MFSGAVNSVFIVLFRFVKNIGMVYVGCHILKKFCTQVQGLKVEVSATH